MDGIESVMRVYFAVSTMAGGIISILFAVASFVAVLFQLRKLSRTTVSPDVDVKAVKFKISLPATVVLFGGSLVSLYFFTVNRKWEFEHTKTVVPTAEKLCDLTTIRSKISAQQFDGDPVVEKRLIALLNGVVKGKATANRDSDGAQIGKAILDNRLLAKRFANVVIVNILQPAEIEVYCRWETSGVPSDASKADRETFDKVKALVNSELQG